MKYLHIKKSKDYYEKRFIEQGNKSINKENFHLLSRPKNESKPWGIDDK